MATASGTPRTGYPDGPHPPTNQPWVLPELPEPREPSDPPDPPGPPAEPRPRGRWARRRRWLIALVAVVALLGAGALAAVRLRTGDIRPGVHVLGVDLGGKSRAAAARRLRDGLAARLTAPVPVRVGTAAMELNPADAGLALDVDATVTAATRARPRPWTALFGRDPVAPVVTVDPQRLHAVLSPHVGAQGSPPVNPAIRYDRLVPVPVYPVAGSGVDPDEAAGTVRRTWLRRSVIAVPIAVLVPQTSREEVDRLLRDLARPAVAGPVALSTVKGEVQIPPAAIAAALQFEPDGRGRITPRVDEGKLRQALGASVSRVETPPKNAGVTIQNKQPSVTAHVDGQVVDGGALARDLLAVLGQPAPRRVVATLVAAPPQLTTGQVEALGIREQVSTFTTKFVAGQSRVVNIKKVADLARGTIVPPGGTFSLNALTGDRTLAKGYVLAPGIENGKIKNAPGGGISQVATTMFNAAYYAGLEDVVHRPHSYYFDRYPAVIEATTIYPSLDMAFRNDSPHGILIDTSHTATSLTVTLWGTKRFDISTVWGPRTNQTAPRTVYLQEDDCNPTAGIPGFQQEAWRVFKQGGQEIKRERFFWRYSAEPKFICGPPPG